MSDDVANAGSATLGLPPESVGTVLGDRIRVAEALDQAFRWSDRTSALEGSAVRVAELLNCKLIWPNHVLPAEAPHPAIVAFVEQWIIDVATMNEATRDAAREVLGADGLMDFIHSLLVIEQRVRLDIAWQRLGLLPAAGTAATDASSHLDHWGKERANSTDAPTKTGSRPGDSRLTAALSEWQAAVVCLDEVDPITTELVRLRCAKYHDCLT